jgi:hypothetical protein
MSQVERPAKTPRAAPPPCSCGHGEKVGQHKNGCTRAKKNRVEDGAGPVVLESDSAIAPLHTPVQSEEPIVVRNVRHSLLKFFPPRAAFAPQKVVDVQRDEEAEHVDPPTGHHAELQYDGLELVSSEIKPGELLFECYPPGVMLSSREHRFWIDEYCSTQ